VTNGTPCVLLAKLTNYRRLNCYQYHRISSEHEPLIALWQTSQNIVKNPAQVERSAVFN